ncbi:FeoA family protein [Leptospira kanakyensis]|uniref:Ferrous iron transport protein A n=1 Tax=Leptospira kanakyensis TaxID=2484968 RepID=A0A6N4PSG3_9LEPT|nr:FeoA family protein [Leptospira kanakyensis]MCW7470028.1 ferrous iron transport protein A [Leptospira kanakyensis]MCW7481011.1 ferrous iron transport protein A [Leptospira kanakyensis]TGK47803.1 ferrous iron transport protein A [Leptospira kanakyensis]TGK63197.1 ferrous iron transport protein A [Leptospira kanakyensis]TGK66804.1 ferrous iron transport protein A [Leptospira kanakyensis]
MTIQDLKIGEKAEIVSLDSGKLTRPMLTELLELGFFPGAEITLKDKSSLLGKMVCVLSGTTIALRIGDGNAIQVKIKST